MESIILSHQDVVSLLGEQEILNGVETVFREQGRNAVDEPGKIALDLTTAGGRGLATITCAHLSAQKAAGIKMAGNFPGNSAKGMPKTMSTIILFDPETGATRCIMDGRYITIGRTGAMAAIAAGYLISNPAILGVFGAGDVGRAVIRYFCASFRLKEIRVFDTSPSMARNAVAKIDDRQSSRIRTAENPTDCLDGADVIVTATTADSPLFAANQVGKNAVVITLGSDAELPEELVLRASFRVVDLLASHRQRGDFGRFLSTGRLIDSDIHADLGQIVAGSSPLHQQEGWTVAALLGMGALDVCLAQKVYAAALEKGRGVRFEF